MSDNALALPQQNTQTLDAVTRVIESSTLSVNTTAEKLAFAKALLSAKSARDNILNKEFMVSDIVVQATEMLNERSGVIETVPRTILVNDKGDAYYAFGVPVYRDARTILAVFDGRLPEPIAVTVGQGGTGNSKYLTLDIK